MAFRVVLVTKVFLTVVCINILVILFVYHRGNNGSKEKLDDVANYLGKETSQTEPPFWRLKQLVDKELPSLPLEDLLANEGMQGEPNETCTAFPVLTDINFQNDYWQETRNGDTVYYIFGAYYDKRETLPKGPLVRILTMCNEFKNNYPQMYCQLWFKDQREPLLVPVMDYTVIWYWSNTPRHVYPTLVNCAMPEGNDKYKIPKAVSLVTKECERATNYVRVYYELPSEEKQHDLQSQLGDDPKPLKRKRNGRFAVCIKALDFPYVDLSARIVEWLEMMRLLGAEKVTIYNAQMHPNMVRVLKHYEKTTGFVDLRGYSMARGEPHTTKHFQHFAMEHDGLNRILHEIIPYNDCFYRNLYQYDYIAVCDIDEVIMPLGNLTDWPSLIQALDVLPEENKFDASCEGSTSYCFRNVYFPRYPEKPPRFPEMPEYFYMLQHVERVAEHLDLNSAIKCLHTTKYAVGLHNHFPLSWVQDCGIKSVPINMGQMQHYREPDIKSTLLNPVVDKNIWRFHDQLVNRTNTVLKEFYLRHPDSGESVEEED